MNCMIVNEYKQSQFHSAPKQKSKTCNFGNLTLVLDTLNMLRKYIKEVNQHLLGFP